MTGGKVKIKSVGIVANPEKKGIRETVKYISGYLHEKGMEVFITYQNFGVQYNQYMWENAEIDRKPEVAVVLGGDGTLIQAARVFAKDNIPILGINLGHLGFLTAVEKAETDLALEKLQGGDYIVEDRMMVKGKVFRNGQKIFQSITLNDIVVKAVEVRLLKMELSINGENMGLLVSDGVILSSPTGSTAYSLSAGGPVVPPYLDSIIFTTLNAVSTSIKPLVLGPDDSVTLTINNDTKTIISLDGQYPFDLEEGDVVVITRATMRCRLIQVKDRSFFNLLGKKLNIKIGRD